MHRPINWTRGKEPTPLPRTSPNTFYILGETILLEQDGPYDKESISVLLPGGSDVVLRSPPDSRRSNKIQSNARAANHPHGDSGCSVGRDSEDCESPSSPLPSGSSLSTVQSLPRFAYKRLIRSKRKAATKEKENFRKEVNQAP